MSLGTQAQRGTSLGTCTKLPHKQTVQRLLGQQRNIYSRIATPTINLKETHAIWIVKIKAKNNALLIFVHFLYTPFHKIYDDSELTSINHSIVKTMPASPSTLIHGNVDNNVATWDQMGRHGI